MCAKKKAAPNRTWRLAGEPLRFAPLTMYERQRITDEFLDYKGLIRTGWLPDGICVTSNEAKIIESATMTVSSYLCDRFAGRYEREAIVVAVATMTAVPTKSSAEAGKLPTFLMGAALWLLDYLEEICEDPEEYLSILPLEPDMVLDYAMPFADDLNHSHDTILRMLAVLDGREGAYRKNFRNLLRMVSEDTAMQLRGLFRDSLVDFMDRTLTVCQTLNIPPWEPQPVNLLVPHNSPDEFRDEHPAIRFLHMAHELICQPVPIIRKRLNSRKAAELVSGYSTSDPYALCMAFLLLEKEKDVLANLNALTAVVMICAMRHLPWAQDDLAARAGLFQSGAPDYWLRYEYSDVPSEEDEEPLEMDWRLSETQLFFLATGVVLPRNRVPSDKLVGWFMRQGVPEQRARELAWAAFMAYYVEDDEYRWHSVDLFSDDWDEGEPPAEEPEDICEAPSVPADAGAGDAKIEELTRKLKATQSALHDAERTANRLREQLRNAEQKGEVERSELVQLRETLYQLRAGEDEAESDNGPLVELPWQVRRRTVVFGGHDSWRKAVKPLLPGARFYDREALPDLNTIRGADVVWLQVNAMSHKYYYRIIDAARKNDIPVRYFGSASAKKCAVQLALDELAAERKSE